MNLKDKLLAIKPKAERVEIPFVDEPLYIREMLGVERDEFESSTYLVNGTDVEVNRVNLRARLVGKCVTDADGVRLFGDHELDLVGSIPSSTLSKLYDVACKLNGFSKEDVEELTKN